MIRIRFEIILPFIACYFLHLSTIFCQEETSVSDERISISALYGDQRWIDVEYNYKSYLLKTSYLKEIHSGKAWSFSLLVQPILGISDCLKHRASLVWEKGYEVGLGVGGRIDVNLYHSRLFWILTLQSGPHYISAAPARQLPGFLFSSEGNTGFSVVVGGGTKLQFILGFRHLSNAEVRLPNGGLNNLLMGVGMSFEI